MLPAELLFDRFITNIRQAKLFEPHHQILLAVSGGMDSMAMVELFRRSDYPFGIAHCNFRLRGKEADKDQQMVEGIAKKLGVPCFASSFDTKTYAVSHKLSIQMAARDLRYDWLENIRKNHGFDLIATAHHLDDSIETLLINISRGTGIGGLKGIPAKSGKIIRPLLFATRKEIESFAQKYLVEFRVDASNAEVKYLRNKIRHQVIPVLLELNPSLHDTMSEFFSVMQATESFYLDTIRKTKDLCVTKDGDETTIQTAPLKTLPHQRILLYEFLKEFGFSAAVCNDIADNINRQPGKVFHSGSHSLLTERNKLLVYPAKPAMIQEPVSIHAHTKGIIFNEYRFCIDVINAAPMAEIEWPNDKFTVLLDLDKIRFPLTIRSWKAGDKMHPLGMSGSKKLSDLFTDTKTPMKNKKQIPVLLSEKEIAWVAGIRSSENFKITSDTRRILRIICIPNINGIA